VIYLRKEGPNCHIFMLQVTT